MVDNCKVKSMKVAVPYVDTSCWWDFMIHHRDHRRLRYRCRQINIKHILAVKFLECHAEHLLCSTSTRVNRLKEVSDRKNKTSQFREGRRDVIRQLDIQHDLEERTQPYYGKSYYSYPSSVRILTKFAAEKSPVRMTRCIDC